MSEGNILKIGYVISPHGIKGEIKAKFFKIFAPSLNEGLFFEKEGRLSGPFSLTAFRRHGENWILRLANFDSLDRANELVKCSLGVFRRKLPENTYWTEDLVGCLVCTPDGSRIGRVKDVLRTPASDIYVVQGEDGGEKLIPAVKSVVSRIDISEKNITVNHMPGLLDDDDN